MSGAEGGVQELDNASTQKTREVFTVEPALRGGELNRQVSARGGRGRPKHKRDANGMAVVAQIAKSVNTIRQEVRVGLAGFDVLADVRWFGSSPAACDETKRAWSLAIERPGSCDLVPQ